MKRLYEWRYRDDGALLGEPAFAENACAFTLESFAKRGIYRADTRPPDPRSVPRHVIVVVSATGERVETVEDLNMGVANYAMTPRRAGTTSTGG